MAIPDISLVLTAFAVTSSSFESLGNRQVPGRKRIAIDEQGHRLGSDRHGVAFAALPHRKGSGCLEKVVLVIPAWIGQRPVGIIGVQRFEPSVRDTLAISRVHEDVGCLAAAIELDRQRAQVGGLQSEVGNDADTGELGEIPQQRSDRVRPGMDRARERDRLPRKLFPIYRSVGVDRGGFLCETPPRQHGERRHGQRRRAQSLDEAAPAGRTLDCAANVHFVTSCLEPCGCSCRRIGLGLHARGPYP